MAAGEVDRRRDQLHDRPEHQRRRHRVRGGLMKEQNQDWGRNAARSNSRNADCKGDQKARKNFH